MAYSLSASPGDGSVPGCCGGVKGHVAWRERRRKGRSRPGVARSARPGAGARPADRSAQRSLIDVTGQWFRGGASAAERGAGSRIQSGVRRDACAEVSEVSASIGKKNRTFQTHPAAGARSGANGPNVRTAHGMERTTASKARRAATRGATRA